MNSENKTFIGCCLIHFCIGSIYAWSVLYPQLTKLTGWSNSVLITGFSLTILFLGLAASLHQKLSGFKKSTVLYVAVLLWFLSTTNIIGNVISGTNCENLHYFSSIALGVALGLMYVIPINIITGYAIRTSTSAGFVIFCFGLGSVIAAKLFENWNLADITALVPISVYAAIMALGVRLIQNNLNVNETIESPNSFHRDRNWYILAFMFFLNIGIGISLLSNLTQLSLNKNFTIENAVLLVSLAGIVNSAGRFIYPLISTKKGEFSTLSLMLDIQAIALMLILIDDFFWSVGVLIIISIYGGLFALMPALLKPLYNNPTAYSQILSMWGFSGLICPLIFNQFGILSLCFMCGILLLSFCFIRYVPKTNR